MTFINSLEEAENFYADTPEVHTTVFKTFFESVNDDEELKFHRDVVEQNEFGYGDRPFHWMWNLIVKDLPQSFKFLEIGVYQGQVISLISLLNKRYKKNGQIYGLTPLEPADDAFSKHPDINYEERIMQLYAINKLDALDTSIIKGYSNDPEKIKIASELGQFDCIYIDGNHNYEVVVQDIQHYGPMIKEGGLLVMDDSANFLNIPKGLIRMDWFGILDVSNAVKDILETNPEFTHIFSVGHNRIWRKNESA